MNQMLSKHMYSFKLRHFAGSGDTLYFMFMPISKNLRCTVDMK